MIMTVVIQVRRNSIDNYLKLSILNGQTLGDLCEVNYNTRLMHLAGHYSNLQPYFDQFKKNVSVSVSSLQNGQF